MDKVFSTILHDLRTHRGWTQLELAERCSSTRGRIAALERDAPPREHELERIARALQVSPRYLAQSVVAIHVPANTDLLRQFAVRPGTPTLERPRHTWVRLRHACQQYGALAQHLLRTARGREDRKLVGRFMHEATCGSSDEGMTWLHCLARPSIQPRFCSPSRIGYRDLAILDAKNKVVGDLPVPCLYVPEPFPCVLFPQITVRLAEIPKDYPYKSATMDFLVGAKLKRGQPCWANGEVDGLAHDDELDQARKKAIGLPRIEIQPCDLRRADFPQRLMERVRQALG